MNIQPFVVIPKNYPHPLTVIGVKVTVLASNAATQGYEITMQEGDEGSGPPPHSHNWDESFYVVKGKVECSHGDKTVMAEPGTLVHLPAGTVHSFRFGAGGGAMIEISGPGGFASKIFTNIDKEIPPGPPRHSQTDWDPPATRSYRRGLRRRAASSSSTTTTRRCRSRCYAADSS